MLRVPRNRSKAQTDRQGGKVARAKVTVTSDYPALKSGGGGPGNHSKRLEKRQRERPITNWLPTGRARIPETGSGAPSVGEVGVAEMPQQPGKQALRRLDVIFIDKGVLTQLS